MFSILRRPPFILKSYIFPDIEITNHNVSYRHRSTTKETNKEVHIGVGTMQTWLHTL